MQFLKDIKWRLQLENHAAWHKGIEPTEHIIAIKLDP